MEANDGAIFGATIEEAEVFAGSEDLHPPTCQLFVPGILAMAETETCLQRRVWAWGTAFEGTAGCSTAIYLPMPLCGWPESSPWFSEVNLMYHTTSPAIGITSLALYDGPRLVVEEVLPMLLSSPYAAREYPYCWQIPPYQPEWGLALAMHVQWNEQGSFVVHGGQLRGRAVAQQDR